MKSTPNEHYWIKTNSFFLENENDEIMKYEVLKDDDITSINVEGDGDDDEQLSYVSDTDSDHNASKTFESLKTKVNDISNEEVNNNYSFIKVKAKKNKFKNELKEEEYVNE